MSAYEPVSIEPEVSDRSLRAAEAVALAAYRGRGGGWIGEDPAAAAQAGLLKALRHFDPARGRFGPLARLCVRQAVARAMDRPHHAGLPDGHDGPAAPAPRDPWPDWAPPAAELVAWLRGRERQVAAALFLDGLSPGEAAARVGVSEATVFFHRARAVAKIRAMLLRRFPDDYPARARGGLSCTG